jgi:hypothetical protein
MVYGIQEAYREPVKMKLAACFLIVSAGVWSAAPADEPPSPAAQPPAAQAPAPPATQPPAAQAPAPPAAQAPAPPAAEKSEVANAAATEADINKMRSRGYKTVKRNGKLMFCRDEGAIGTSFQRTNCSTLEQLKEADLGMARH